ncbi:TolC family protein [Aquabacterium lacunae]|uniref:TolC family protein n=1 Tax=Aquabacterium lacunae TaxID=2528630 RepID=A0A4Q9H4Q1_9BURK|nr:TolC family protein [Aquabacterium lacunae]TBO31189.1 TolC family protein [Aquabacterium lacunae]
MRAGSWGAAVGLSLAGLAGCSHAPRDDASAAWLAQARFTSVSSATADAADAGDATSRAQPVPVRDDAWWRAVGGAPLDRLVRWGLARNHDVALALTRVQEARAGEVAQGSALWPTLSLQGARATTASDLPAPVKQGRPDTRALQASLNLDWELDLFGRAQAARRGAAQDVLASEAGVAGARLLLMAEISRQHVLHRAAAQRQEALGRLTEAQAGVVQALTRRAAEGEESLLAVDAATARLDELRAQQRQLDTLQAATRGRLKTLADVTDAELAGCLDASVQLPWDHLPPPVPSGQAVTLLERRPDLMAARAQWMAEQARRASAEADLLPRVFLSLVTGRQDLRLNGLDLSPVSFHESALAFALPLFNAGRIRAGIERQDALLQRAELRYAQAARQAFEDVEVALVDARQSARRAQDQARVLAARERAAQRAAHLYAEGQIAQPERLALVQALEAARLARIDAVEAAWLSHIQLQRALGGGWPTHPAKADAAAVQSLPSEPQP